MTQEQLQDALGMIDDDLIETVDNLRQQRDDSDSSNNLFHNFRKKIIRLEAVKWGSVAAGICLLVGVGFLWSVGGNTTADMANESDNQYSKQENAEAVMDDSKNGAQSLLPDKPFENSPETAPAAISSPPELYIVTEENISLRAMKGTYSWSWTTDKGRMFVESDSYHPLDSQKYLTPMKTAKPSVQLQFDTSTHGEPYAVSVRCWSDAYWNRTDVDGCPLSVTNGQISLQEGGTIYQVIAKWSSGTAYYAFYVYYTPE